MRQRLTIVALLWAAGCAPRQDPGVPLPPPSSGAAAFSTADLAIGPQADTVKAIDTAKKIVAENLANAETTGFKALCCRVQNGRPEVFLNFEQGSLESTNRDLDVAIEGNGFFRVKIDPNWGDGFAYTRNGNFFRNKDGDLVIGMGEGYRLDPPISIPSDSVNVSMSTEGIVQVMRSGQVVRQTVGQINLYQFVAPQNLSHKGSLFQQTDDSGSPIESKPKENAAGALQQGFLEGSNVDLTREKLRGDYLDRWRAIVMK